MPLAVFLLGLWKIRRRTDPAIIIVVLSLLTFLAEIHGTTEFFGNNISFFVQNLYSYILYVFVLLYYYIFLHQKITKNYLVIVLCICALAVLTLFTFHIDNVRQYQQMSWPIGNLIMIAFSVWVLLVSGKDISSPLKRKTVFWVSLSMVVYNTGSILDFALRPYAAIINDPGQVYKILLNNLIVICIISYSLLFKGIWETKWKA